MSTFGPAYHLEIDGLRIQTPLERVREYMLRSSGWRSLSEIATATGDLSSSVSAQLRHLRKPRFGAYLVEKRRREGHPGTWEYRVSAGGDWVDWL